MRRAWALALALAGVSLFALELGWRGAGHRPSLVDDERLWSIEREKVGKEPGQIVLAGSSRILTDVSPAVLRELSGRSVVNLGIDGSCANLVLRDLAEDPSFRGVVLADVTAECVIFGDEDQGGARAYLKYYHAGFPLRDKVDRVIASRVQESLCIVDPYLNLLKVAGHYLARREPRTPKYWRTLPDRSQDIDYQKVEIDDYRAGRLEKVRGNYRSLSARISPAAFERGLAQVEAQAARIRQRGGTVVLVNFPVSGEHWALDEEYFPKAKLWDPGLARFGPAAVHFKEVPALGAFECPDLSHLDFRDKPAFTTALFEELAARGVLP